MRLLWVQTVLPVIVEDREMADENVQSGRLPPGVQAVDPARTRISEKEGSSAPRTLCLPSIFHLFACILIFIFWLCTDLQAANVSGSNFPYEFHLQGATPQQQLPGGQVFNVPGQQAPGYQMGRGQSPNAFNMSGLAGALPEYQASTPLQVSHFDQQRTPSAASAYQGQQYSGHPIGANYPTQPSQYATQYQAYGQIPQNQQAHLGGPSPIQSSYPGAGYFPAQQQQLMYYPGQYSQSGQPQHGPYPSYGQGSGHVYGQQGGDMSAMGGRTSHSGYSTGAAIPYAYGTSGPFLRPAIPGKQLAPRSRDSID